MISALNFISSLYYGNNNQQTTLSSPSRSLTNEPPTIEPVLKNNKDDNELYEKITKEIVQKEIVPYLEIKDIVHLTSIDTKINAKGDITEPIKGTVICNNMKHFENIYNNLEVIQSS